MRFPSSIAAAVLFTGLMAGLLVWGADLIGGPAALPMPELDDEVAANPERLTVLLAASDQAVTMSTTLALGLVVLVGFTLKLAEGRPALITTADRIVGLCFIGVLFASVFFGFASRRLALDLTHAGYPDWTTVQDAINRQAVLLALATSLAFYLAIRSLERMQGAAEATPIALRANTAAAEPASPAGLPSPEQVSPDPGTARPARAAARRRRRGGVGDA